MSNALPQGWATARLDELCDRVRGVSYARDEASAAPKRGSLPILRANNIDDDRLVFEDLVYVPTSRISATQRIRKGDVVIAMSSGSKSVVGKTAQALQAWDGAFGAFCGVLRPSSELVSRYFGLFLRTQDYRHRISELSAGTSINNLKAEHFTEIEVPLAPLAEQRRIVAKLEQLLVKVDASQQRLAKMPVLLKRFRQSVLAAACSGRLTADWREEKGTEESWPTATLGDVAELVSGAGFPLEHQGKHGLPYPFFKVGNLGDVESGQELMTSEHSVDERLARELRAKVIPKGAVVFAKIGMAIALNRRRQLGRPACIDNNMMGAIPTERVYPRYLLRFLETVDLMPLSQATTVPSLRKSDLEEIDIPLPPLAEQQEIVRRVEGLFALADQIEARFAQARAQVERLAPSLLAKAFRGELVPQDPTDEPAEALLQRIHAGKAGLKEPTSARTARKTPSRSEGVGTRKRASGLHIPHRA